MYILQRRSTHWYLKVYSRDFAHNTPYREEALHFRYAKDIPKHYKDNDRWNRIKIYKKRN